LFLGTKVLAAAAAAAAAEKARTVPADNFFSKGISRRINAIINVQVSLACMYKNDEKFRRRNNNESAIFNEQQFNDRIVKSN